MHGKCNCGKKATSEWAVHLKNYASTLKFCNDCRPKHKTKNLSIIYGK